MWEGCIDLRLTKSPLYSEGQGSLLWQTFSIHAVQIPATPLWNVLLSPALLPTPHQLQSFLPPECLWHLFKLLISELNHSLFYMITYILKHPLPLQQYSKLLKDRNNIFLFFHFFLVFYKFILYIFIEWINETIVSQEKWRKARTRIISCSVLLLVNDRRRDGENDRVLSFSRCSGKKQTD